MAKWRAISVRDALRNRSRDPTTNTAARQSWGRRGRGAEAAQQPPRGAQKKTSINAGCDRVIFPINRPGHWTCAMVDVAGKRIVYLDSMSKGGEDPEVPEALAEWYKLDRAEKKQEDLPTEDWPIEYWDCPQQRNGYDCGVFAAKFCDYLGRGAELSFGQEHMALFRERMVADICRNRAD